MLAGQLPLPIPQPLARGRPGEGYPWPWSVYRWLDGEPATVAPIADLAGFATDLADFLHALYGIDPAGGPPPGPHNFFRGGPLSTYDAETEAAIKSHKGAIDTDGADEIWEAGLAASWSNTPVWVHGDISPENLLVLRGHLAAVIDFGCLGVGDPACDLTIAWTFFSGESRDAFRTRLQMDRGTWARGRAWALWKALITVASDGGRLADGDQAKRIIKEVIAEHRALA